MLGFFTLTGHGDRPLPEKYALLVLFVLVSVGLFFAIDAMTPLGPAMLTVTYAAVALNIFYWFAGPVLIRSFGR